MPSLKSLITTGLFLTLFFANGTCEPVEYGTLLQSLEQAKNIMWIGPHPDDELYLGGTLGYATRDLGRKLTIISFGRSPQMIEANRRSAEFLNNAEYLYLDANGKCDMGTINEAVEKMVSTGVKDKIVRLIRKKHPDIIFTFETSNGYRTNCAHIVSALVAETALAESGVESQTFFILNRDPLMVKILGGEMDPLPVTDVIDLNQRLWEYRMAVFRAYSPFYPAIRKVLTTPALEESLLHQEFFRKAE